MPVWDARKGHIEEIFIVKHLVDELIDKCQRKVAIRVP